MITFRSLKKMVEEFGGSDIPAHELYNLKYYVLRLDNGQVIHINMKPLRELIYDYCGMLGNDVSPRDVRLTYKSAAEIESERTPNNEEDTSTGDLGDRLMRSIENIERAFRSVSMVLSHPTIHVDGVIEMTIVNKKTNTRTVIGKITSESSYIEQRWPTSYAVRNDGLEVETPGGKLATQIAKDRTSVGDEFMDIYDEIRRLRYDLGLDTIREISDAEFNAMLAEVV